VAFIGSNLNKLKRNGITDIDKNIVATIMCKYAKIKPTRLIRYSPIDAIIADEK
jgi:hypothetical protein